MSGVGPSTAHTIQDHIALFLDTTARTSSSSQAALTRQALHVFSNFLRQQISLNPNRHPLQDLNLTTFRNFLDYLQDNYSPETEHAYFRAIIAFMATAEHGASHQPLTPQITALARTRRRKKLRQELHIPAQQIVRLRHLIQQSSLPDPLTSERLRLGALRDRALILTILDTGLKSSELSSLRINNFDPTNHRIIFSDVQLPISPPTFQALHQYLSARSSLDHKQQGRPYDALALFARHDKRAGSRILQISRWTVTNIVTYWVSLLAAQDSHTPTPNISPTTLRHFFVISTLNETDNLQLTQQRARHKAKTTTQRYLHRHKTSHSG